MIYLDHAATTPPFKEALDRFTSISSENFGNPSSLHAAGFSASRELEASRSNILNLMKVNKTHGLLFTSGATEANALAIKGVAFKYQSRGKKIITTAVEHPSVLNSFRQLGEAFGFEVVILPVNQKGQVEPSVLEQAMDKSTILVSIMAVNNETGSINDLPKLIQVVRKFPKAYFHSDVTQAIGKLNLPYQDIDLITFSAHKFGGLKGNGGLAYRKSIQFLPLLSGGSQEFNFRAGTVDVAGASAMSKALSLTFADMAKTLERAKGLSKFARERLSEIDEVAFNSPEDASPFVLNFSLLAHKASVIVEAMSEKGYCVSSVSACSSKGEPVSYVVEAMGYDKERAGNTMRISFGHDTELEDVAKFIIDLKKALKEVRPR
ncbi:MAG: cysteine desulfurase [Bacilli bacterium]|nr:cysteine desulfurase [Bacilli bacterium]